MEIQGEINKKPLGTMVRRAAGGMALVGTLGALTSCSSEGESEPAGSQETQSPVIIVTPGEIAIGTPDSANYIGEQVLNSVAACGQLEADSSLMDKLEGLVVVDGRCDPSPEAAVGVYDQPEQAGDSPIDAYNGDVFHAVCIEEGQHRQNQLGDGSREWVEVAVEDETAYIPEIWTQGAQSLPDCP